MPSSGDDHLLSLGSALMPDLTSLAIILAVLVTVSTLKFRQKLG